jgi:hypothetical protein
MSGKQRDLTGLYVTGLWVFLAGAAVFSIAIEMLKFAALVKWVFS